MFTGIIEALGKVEQIEKEGDNLHFRISSPFSHELKIDQSVAHDGVCLTVVALHEEGAHTVTAIRETLERTQLGEWQVGRRVNVERAMRTGARLDGHTVQGHVDDTARVLSIEQANGSWVFTFEYADEHRHLLVDKGSVCINGTSLTVVNPVRNQFSVAIIPYTFAHTGFQFLQVGERVNIEFDIIGKYIARYAALYLAKG